MAKNAVTDWSTTASSNTDVGGIAIQGVNVISNFDNAMREIMAQIATFNTGASFTSTLTLTSTDAGASAGPILVLDRNSASPAASDVIGYISFRGRDSGGNATEYALLQTVITDPANGSEDGSLQFYNAVAGVSTLQGQITATGWNGMNIGATTRGTGAFTTLSASGAFSLTGDVVQVSEGGTGASSFTNGFLTGFGSSAIITRTIDGTTNEISVANPAGVLGNPTISLPSALTFTGKTVTGGQYNVVGTGQSVANLRMRKTGQVIEFGHNNINGYGSAIGAESSSGIPYIAFNAEQGTNTNSYLTRGIVGTVISADLSGGLVFSKIATASADNQSKTTLASISNAGSFSATSINSTPIGSTTPSTGAFTSLSVSGTGTGSLLTLTSTDAGAVGGPIIDLYRDSASPATSDSTGQIQFNFKDSGGNKTLGAAVVSGITDATDGSEDFFVGFNTIQAGTYAGRFVVGNGVYTANATGTDQGADTINAKAVYDDGVLLCAPLEEAVTGKTSRKKWQKLAPNGGFDVYDTMKKAGFKPRNARAFVNEMQAKQALPGYYNVEEWEEANANEKRVSLAARHERLLLTLDLMALAIADLTEKVEELQAKETSPENA